MAHTITIDKAGEIDTAYINAAQPDNMLRIVNYRRVTMLEVPMDTSAPAYQYHRHDPITGEYAPAYYHSAGPTLAQWYAEQDSRDERETQRDALDMAVQ